MVLHYVYDSFELLETSETKCQTIYSWDKFILNVYNVAIATISELANTRVWVRTKYKRPKTLFVREMRYQNIIGNCSVDGQNSAKLW